jgi:hypothetical protein
MESNNEGTQRLQNLCALMQEYDYDAYILPHTDSHDVKYSYNSLE